LDGAQVRCRNAAGRTLKQVPAKLRDDVEVVRLRQLAEWLERHEQECRSQVDTWIVRSLPVPTDLLARVWPDAAWQGALRDLVVAPVDADGTVALERAGFLRDADPEQGLGVVDLDGDSVRLAARTVVIPHPVLLEDLEELREFAAELGVEQGAGQLFREVWPRPDERDGEPFEWSAYAGGKFEELRHATARAGSYGYRVRGVPADRERGLGGGSVLDRRRLPGVRDPYRRPGVAGRGRAPAAAAGGGASGLVGGGPDGGFGVRGACGEQRGRGGGAVSGDQLLESGAVLPLGEGAGDVLTART
jgi:hypothetical protein